MLYLAFHHLFGRGCTLLLLLLAVLTCRLYDIIHPQKHTGGLNSRFECLDLANQHERQAAVRATRLGIP